jgi:hypothetical protein
MACCKIAKMDAWLLALLKSRLAVEVALACVSAEWKAACACDAVITASSPEEFSYKSVVKTSLKMLLRLLAVK